MAQKSIYLAQARRCVFLLMLGVTGAMAVPENTPDTPEAVPPSSGNFALPTSQQPGPLISLGQNIIDKGQTQLFLYADQVRGNGKYAIDLIPSLLYGITDEVSVFVNVPIAAGYKQDQQHSAGMEDIFVQAEYAFYSRKTSQWADQATLMANVTFPTGSAQKQPPTGAGAATFLIGATYSRVAPTWFAFASPGVVLATSHQGTKLGNQYLYQAGFGRNIAAIKSEYVFSWMMEVDGQLSQRNKIMNISDLNSGGNTIYITPSLWLSSKKWVAQFGVGLPVVQHLFGDQKRNHYSLAINIGWTF